MYRQVLSFYGFFIFFRFFLSFYDTMYSAFNHLNEICAGYKFQILIRILSLTSLLASSSSVVVLLLVSEAAGGFYKKKSKQTKHFFWKSLLRVTSRNATPRKI